MGKYPDPQTKSALTLKGYYVLNGKWTMPNATYTYTVPSGSTLKGRTLTGTNIVLVGKCTSESLSNLTLDTSSLTTTSGKAVKNTHLCLSGDNLVLNVGPNVFYLRVVSPSLSNRKDTL